MSYRVKAPYVTATLADEAGTEHVRGFYGGMMLPPSVTPASVKSLLAKEMIEKVKAVVSEPEPDAKEQAESGSLAEALKKQAEATEATEAPKADPKKVTVKPVK